MSDTRKAHAQLQVQMAILALKSSVGIFCTAISRDHLHPQPGESQQQQEPQRYDTWRQHGKDISQTRQSLSTSCCDRSMVATISTSASASMTSTTTTSNVRSTIGIYSMTGSIELMTSSTVVNGSLLGSMARFFFESRSSVAATSHSMWFF
jgi:hypothetical protein